MRAILICICISRIFRSLAVLGKPVAPTNRLCTRGPLHSETHVCGVAGPVQNPTSNIQCSGLEISSSGPWMDSSNARINSSHRQNLRKPPDAFPACSEMKLTKPNERKGTYPRPWKRCAEISFPESSNSRNPGRGFFTSDIVPNHSRVRTDRSQSFSFIT